MLAREAVKGIQQLSKSVKVTPKASGIKPTPKVIDPKKMEILPPVKNAKPDASQSQWIVRPGQEWKNKVQTKENSLYKQN